MPSDKDHPNAAQAQEEQRTALVHVDTNYFQWTVSSCICCSSLFASVNNSRTKEIRRNFLRNAIKLTEATPRSLDPGLDWGGAGGMGVLFGGERVVHAQRTGHAHHFLKKEKEFREKFL
jgi:hypothetical protein